MEYFIDLSLWLDAIITIGCAAFFVLLIVAVFFSVKAAITSKNVRALQKVMLEQMKLGEKVTINDPDHSYFSFHVIRIGINVYYPVLTLQDGKVVVDHLLKSRNNCYAFEKISGSEYETLCFQEKYEEIKRKI